jgi:hypothetical protein
MLPFNEEWISQNESLRIFTPNVFDEELKWHTDWEDRVIDVINENDWKFQFDNELPIQMKGRIIIEKGVWHRVIKGTSNLEIKITRI